MIEVRIDIHWMQTQQHNVMHSILMMQALREAGMPIVGKIIFNGPERGTLIQHRENDLDGDEWVVQWFDDDEVISEAASQDEVARGSGKGYTWVRRHNPGKPDRRYLLRHDESDSYVEVFTAHEANRCMDEGCDDVTGDRRHEAAWKLQKEEVEW